jgi:chaperonin GroES
MKLKPLGERLVAVQVEAETKSKAGLFIPDSAKEKTQIAEVLAVGKKITELKAGDQILYNQYGPAEIKFEDKDYLLMKEEDVLAVVK